MRPDPITVALTDPEGRLAAARQRLASDLVALEREAASLPAKLSAYLMAARGLFAAADTELAKGAARPDGAISIFLAAESLAEVGRNAFQVLANQAGLTDLQRQAYARVGSLFGDVLCVIRGLWQQFRRAADYSTVRGASTCSSTLGGTPPSIHADTNVIDKIFAANRAATGLKLSTRALSEIQTWRADVMAHGTGAAADAPRSLYEIARGVALY